MERWSVGEVLLVRAAASGGGGDSLDRVRVGGSRAATDGLANEAGGGSGEHAEETGEGVRGGAGQAKLGFRGARRRPSELAPARAERRRGN